MALCPGGEPGLLDGVRLEELIELGLRAPVAAVIVELEISFDDVDDDRKAPLRQTNDQAGGFAGVEPSRALDGFGQSEPTAGGRDRWK